MELKSGAKTLIVLNRHNIDAVGEKTGMHPDDLLRMLSDARREGKSTIILNEDGSIW